jgi:hypothetical protein
MTIPRAWAAVLLVLGAAFGHGAMAQEPNAALVEKGRQLAIAADCMACHTAPASLGLPGRRQALRGRLRHRVAAGHHLRNQHHALEGGRHRRVHRGRVRARAAPGRAPRRQPPVPGHALHLVHAAERRGHGRALRVLHARRRAGRCRRGKDRAALPLQPAMVDGDMEPAVPGQPALRARRHEKRRVEPRRLPGRRAGPLQRLPHAAQRADGRARRPGAGGRRGRALVCAQHHVGPGERHRRLERTGAGAVPAHRPGRRQGTGRGRHGRGGAEQPAAPARRRPARDRRVPEGHAADPRRGSQGRRRRQARARVGRGLQHRGHAARQPAVQQRGAAHERRAALQRLLRELPPVERRGQPQPGVSEPVPQHGHGAVEPGEPGGGHPLRGRPASGRHARADAALRRALLRRPAERHADCRHRQLRARALRQRRRACERGLRGAGARRRTEAAAGAGAAVHPARDGRGRAAARLAGMGLARAQAARKQSGERPPELHRPRRQARPPWHASCKIA